MVAQPHIAAKKYSSLIRFVLLLTAIGLLAALLKPRWDYRAVLPARAPLRGGGIDSSLRVSMLCFLQETVPKACRFDKDRFPVWVMTDELLFFPMAFVLYALWAMLHVWWTFLDDYDTGDERRQNKMKLSWKSLAIEVTAVLISAVWAGFSLFQSFELWRWMNRSGLLRDDKERVVNTFGGVLSSFLLFSLMIQLATAYDGDLPLGCQTASAG